MSRDNCWFNSSCCSVIICTGVVSEICVTACMLLLLWKPVYYFLAIFLSSSSFFFLPSLIFRIWFSTPPTVNAIPPRITPWNGTAVPKLLLQLSRVKKKKKRKKKRKKVGFQSIICLWLKVKKKKKRTGNSVGEIKKTVCVKHHLQNKCISA